MTNTQLHAKIEKEEMSKDNWEFTIKNISDLDEVRTYYDMI